MKDPSQVAIGSFFPSMFLPFFEAVLFFMCYIRSFAFLSFVIFAFWLVPVR